MNFVLTVHFPYSIFEYALPGVDNRTVEVTVPSRVSGFLTDAERERRRTC